MKPRSRAAVADVSGLRVRAEPAWVLHARPYRETSALLELLTHAHGRVGAIARAVRGPRRQWLRAALQPFTPLRVDWLLRGELATVVQVEIADAPVVLAGRAAFAGLYLNELTLRLLARGDPAADLFLYYSQTLARLAAGEPLAWTLRRYERDLLAHVGVGFDYECDSNGTALRPDARYHVDFARGRIEPADVGGVRGSALLALARDTKPEAEDLRDLRLLLRAGIAPLLDGKSLRSWDLLTELGPA